MGARMVAFLESLLSGLDCLDCLAEKGKPESKRHKLETPQLMLGRSHISRNACGIPRSYLWRSLCLSAALTAWDCLAHAGLLGERE